MVQPVQQKEKIHAVPEEQEIDENFDNLDTRSTTRTSRSTSLKRKSTEEIPETKKQQAGTILNFYNATINTHTLHTSSMSFSPAMTPRKKDDSTVQSTPRGT
eukprot:6436275-Amphidinium_carterae.3